MPDWNTRLEVKLGDSTITPISSFTPTFNVPHTVLHSIEADNVGFVRQPFTFTFMMAVPAVAAAVADLTELAANGQEFSVVVAEKKGTDWAFDSMKFARCVVTSANPSNVVIDGVPQASFSCLALDVGLEA
ncbi:hypothetical protein ACOT81_37345 [Streptomyces sp. WI04-05B]|uniref:Uncharacterized protein n=1 Tax=Streptomyces sp. NBC_00093 TaxID=2975649 RepID=A0AAU1ZRK7_9ACTN|nr:MULTISPECIES: hypothetical protein [unclassified Streptomyces]MDX2547449.1 hypothetical protein [Streptomyces sp. WI04-05B]MDX2586292.1 hypothetical protein [Streptomyces sp. WI04-05A]MDX3748942.1 hypothetical protein [Streptomyces sp. AK08-02]